MDAHHLFPSFLQIHCLIPIFFFFFLIAVPTSYSEDDEFFVECNKNYYCGKLPGPKYPFWAGDDRPDFCGHQGFKLTCQDNDDPHIEMENGQTFRVVEINETDKRMMISRTDVWEVNYDPEKFTSTTLNETLFERGPDTTRISIFYGCPFELSTQFPYAFNCTVSGSKTGAFYLDEPSRREENRDLTPCKVVIEVFLPLKVFDEPRTGIVELKDALNQQFGIDYHAEDNKCSECKKSGGICGSNSSSLQQFNCLCRDQPYPLFCQSHGGGLNLGLKLLIGFGAAGGSIIMMLVIFFIYQRRTKNRYVASSYVSRNISSNYSSMTDLEKMGSFFGLHIFTYGELEEATNNFDASKELGDGGFGTVYYGKLKDGRVVAVKRLYENNYKRVEQFMNEIDILTRLRHQNLVLLYGCTSRRSHELLLVYEYIPNGTVADHLHGQRAKPGSLPWPIRLKIAVETASALAYLHASDIIHRDVKTNNILLDNNFCVKVADFGLSRLFPLDVTHVSTAPQGTPGYVDPDYHQCYQLTVKSDVYSFGVVLIELISSKPAVDITRHRHEINLSNMAINKIQTHALQELVDLSLGFESDCKVNKMMTAVAELAFQCLQNEKDIRPTMEEVLESLKDIQSNEHNAVKPEEVHIPADDAVLLKKGSLALSPDSVTVKWISIGSSTTPNASG